MKNIKITNQRGITILEVVIAMLILAGTSLGLEMVYSRSVQAQVNALNTVKAMIAVDTYFQRSLLNPQTRYGYYMNSRNDPPIAHNYEVTSGDDYFNLTCVPRFTYPCLTVGGLDIRSLLVKDLNQDGMGLYAHIASYDVASPNRYTASTISWGDGHVDAENINSPLQRAKRPICMTTQADNTEIIKPDNLFNWSGGNCIVLITHH